MEHLVVLSIVKQVCIANGQWSRIELAAKRQKEQRRVLSYSYGEKHSG